MKAQRSKPTKKNSIIDNILNIAFGIATCINAVLPKLKWVSMCSTPDFSDNARALYEYMQKCEKQGKLKDHTIIWHVLDPLSAKKQNDNLDFQKYKVKFVKKNRLGSMFAFMLSDYIISTHGLYSMIKLSNKQNSSLLWHGMIIKKAGFFYDNDIMLGVTQGDRYFVTSDFFKRVFAKTFNSSLEYIYITGQPRNDLLFRELNEKQRSAVKTLGNKIIVYLPTYRKSNGRNKDNGINMNRGNKRFCGTLDQWLNINNVLYENGYTLVIKPHPLEQTIDYGFMKELSCVKIINEKWLLNHSLSLYSLLSVSESLITDFSSVYIDYLLLNKKIMFFIPDMKEYDLSRGFVLDNILDFLPGRIIDDFGDIYKYILEPDIYKNKRRRINRIFNDIDDNTACSNVFNVIFGD